MDLIMKKSILTIITALHSEDNSLNESFISITPQLTDDVRWLIKYSTDLVPSELLNLTSHSYIDLICRFDSSLYEGLNQALNYCDSEWFMVIGSGDSLTVNAVQKILEEIKKHPNAEAFLFATKHISNDFIITPNPSEIHLRMSCPHPSAILKVKNVTNINFFNTSYKIASDYDLISRYLIAFGNFLCFDDVLVNFKGGGLSDVRGLEAYFEEEIIRTRVWNSPQIDTCYRMQNFLNSAITTLIKNK
jgi:hypothetical protein